MSITICGLGPGEEKYITKQTFTELNNSKKKFVRTEHHPSISAVTNYNSLDWVYEKNNSYEDTYNEIYSILIEAGKTDDITYITPGSPLILENVVELLIDQTDVEISLIPAMSFLDIAWNRLKLDPVKSCVTLIDAQDFGAIDPNISNNILVSQVYSSDIATQICYESDKYEDHKVIVLQNLGTELESIKEIDWIDLLKINPNQLTSLFIPKLPELNNSEIARSLEIISRLRKECPWDKKQTHKSLIPYLNEETEEVIEAINSQGYEELEEELGDVLLQILLQSEIAKEEGEFTFLNVVETLNEKMIRRHPHVFGDVVIDNIDQLEEQWNRIKEEEKENKNKQ